MRKHETKVNSKHKDRLFNFIFGREENREWTLSLYNAVNDSDYTDASMIQFNTLENILYIGLGNDTSFLISGILNVYEQQSSFNPNMPLRMVEYVSSLFAGYINENHYNCYGSALIPLPTPKLVVFYNGSASAEDEVILNLRDSFDEKSRNEADVEVRVRMLNVNYGRNRKIMQACKPLEEYAWFIEKVREQRKSIGNVEDAVKETLRIMPHDYVIRSFLLKHRAEIMGILDTEYNEDKIRELFMEDGRREERVNTEIQRKRAEAEKARAEEEKARAEEEKAKAKEERARAEAEKARADLLEGEKARADSLEEDNNRLNEDNIRLREELENLKKLIAKK